MAQFPSFNAYSVSGVSGITLNYTRSGNDGKNKTEVPPWIIAGGFRSYFFVNGSDTYIWSSPSSLADNNSLDLNNATGPNLASMSYIHSPDYDSARPVRNWKRNYHGIYSAVYFKHPDEGTVSLGFLHSENKNLVEGTVANHFARWYQNTIQANVRINPADPNSYSGGEPFHEGWNAYNAMITAAWIHNNKKTNWGQSFFSNDIGPIAWPSTGFITPNGIKCTSGLKHPSSIIYNDTIYVFFSDGGPFGNNIPDEEGRHEGIKVVRASINDALDPHKYSVYYRDPQGNETWNPSLPEMFTKENMLAFVAVKGPKSTDIMDDEKGISQEIRFSVAHVRNADYFIGVEEYIDQRNLRFKVALRFSSDLLHWTDRVLTVYESPNWESSRMNYPVLLSSDGWSNTEIDIDNFYVLGTGTSPGTTVNKIHILRSGSSAAFTSERIVANSWDLPLNKIFPNPSAGQFKLAYNLDTASHIRINLLDLNGHQLKCMKDEMEEPGQYIQEMDINIYASGLYFIEMLTNNRRSIYKVIKS